jgi:hypothetical protein
MINNTTLPSPFIVAVLEDYYDEKPHNVLVDISKLPVEHGYRRAVVDALNDDGYVEVNYDTLQSIEDPSVAVDKGEVQGSVTLHESGSHDPYDGYTYPEDWDEEDIAAYHADKAAMSKNEDDRRISLREQRWIAAMYHGPDAQYNAEFLAKRFNTTPEVIEQIAKENPPEKPAEDPMKLLNGMLGLFK